MFDAALAQELSHVELAKLCQVVSLCVGAQSQDSLRRVLVGIRELIPFSAGLVGAATRSPDTGREEVHIVSVDYSRDWLEFWVNNDIVREDPLVRFHAEQPEPRVWSSREVAALDRDSNIPLTLRDHCSETSLAMGWRWSAETSGYCCFSGQKATGHRRDALVAEFLRPHLGMALERVIRRDDLQSVELTSREREILYWLKEGKTNWEMSVILSVSERTIKFHVKNLLAKLDASTRAHAVAIGLRLGLIEL